MHNDTPQSLTHPFANQTFSGTVLPPSRVALRLWGYSEPEVAAWLEDLPSSAGCVSWEIARQIDNNRLSALIHLVRASSAASGPFCWNCVGANRTMQRGEGRSPVQIALFSGDAERLPKLQFGVWALVGTRSEKDALQGLARNVVNPLVLHATKASYASRETAPTRGPFVDSMSYNFLERDQEPPKHVGKLRD